MLLDNYPSRDRTTILTATSSRCRGRVVDALEEALARATAWKTVRIIDVLELLAAGETAEMPRATRPKGPMLRFSPRPLVRWRGISQALALERLRNELLRSRPRQCLTDQNTFEERLRQATAHQGQLAEPRFGVYNSWTTS